jgi:predicted alpha/beta hydrolase family esterase
LIRPRKADHGNLKLYFFHGLEGSPQGNKPQFLRKYYPDLITPPLPPDIKKREKILEEQVHGPAYLIGSSLGALSAILFAMKHPEKILGMVLLVPAVGLFDVSLIPENILDIMSTCVIPDPIPTIVIAAEKDEVIPMKAIEDMIARSLSSKIEFRAVDDDHSMSRSLEFVLEAVKKIIS